VHLASFSSSANCNWFSSDCIYLIHHWNHTLTISRTFQLWLGKTRSGKLHGKCFIGFVYAYVHALWSCSKQNL